MIPLCAARAAPRRGRRTSSSRTAPKSPVTAGCRRRAPLRVAVPRGAGGIVAAGDVSGAGGGARAAGAPLPGVVIPPGVDVERFRPVDDETRKLTRCPVVRLRPGSSAFARGCRGSFPAKASTWSSTRVNCLTDVQLAIGGLGRNGDRLGRARGGGRVQFLGLVPRRRPACALRVGGCVRDVLSRTMGWARSRRASASCSSRLLVCGVPSVAGRSGGSHEAVVDGENGVRRRTQGRRGGACRHPAGSLDDDALRDSDACRGAGVCRDRVLPTTCSPNGFPRSPPATSMRCRTCPRHVIVRHPAALTHRSERDTRARYRGWRRRRRPGRPAVPSVIVKVAVIVVSVTVLTTAVMPFVGAAHLRTGQEVRARDRHRESATAVGMRCLAPRSSRSEPKARWRKMSRSVVRVAVDERRGRRQERDRPGRHRSRRASYSPRSPPPRNSCALARAVWSVVRSRTYMSVATVCVRRHEVRRERFERHHAPVTAQRRGAAAPRSPRSRSSPR